MELAVHDKQEAGFDLARHVTCHAALPRANERTSAAGSGLPVTRCERKLPPTLAKSDLFRELGPLRRVVRRDHGIVRR